MAMEITNFLHAQCAFDGATGAFLGQGNDGFAAAGTNPLINTTKIATGRYRMRLLAPINFAGGEGIVIPVAVSQTELAAARRLVSVVPDTTEPTATFIINCFDDTFALADAAVYVTVLRFAQRLTGV